MPAVCYRLIGSNPIVIAGYLSLPAQDKTATNRFSDKWDFAALIPCKSWRTR